MTFGVRTVRMDSHTQSGQVGRLEVVETGRRRRWSEDEKLRIVARACGDRGWYRRPHDDTGFHGLLYTWRRAFRGKARS